MDITLLKSFDINIVFYSVIGGVALFFMLAEFRLSTRYRKMLQPWKTLVKMLSHRHATVSHERLSTQQQSLLHQYFVVDSVSEEGDVTLSQQNSKYLATTPVSAFVPVQPISPYRFVPALLTTIGVLGTFLGISLGLSDFDANGQGSQALMKSATTLLDGMKTAFYTSLAGLLGSILFMVWHALLSKSREFRHRKVINSYQAICLAISPVTLLHRLGGSSQNNLIEKQLEAAEQSIRSNQSMMAVSNQLAQSLVGFDAEKMTASISQAVSDSVEQEISPHLKAISESVKELKAIKEQSSKELVELIVSQMRQEVFEPFNQQLELLSSSNKLTAEAVQQSIMSINQLASKLEEMMLGLDKTTDSLNTFQRDTLVKLQGFADSLKIILSQFKDDTEGALSRVADEIQGALDSSIQGMTLQRKAFEESAVKAADAFSEQNESLKRVGEDSSNLMLSAKESLLEGLGNIDDKVKAMSDVVQRELEVFRKEYQNNLTEFFSKQANLLEETLSEQREGLAGVVNDYKEAFVAENEIRKGQFEAINQQHQKLLEGVDVVSQLVQAVGMNKAGAFNQLEDSAQAISAQVGKLRRTYEEASNRFNEMTEQMPEAMHDYFNRSRSSNERFFDNFDEAAAQVHGKLADAANLLVTAMQQIEMQLISLEKEPVS
ncbi:hypothetical protein [Neptuniibacter marinus]|uniref:hypothetical protein n=1 Tax=Neptuniibacter marinus TaxID=1806670 RepID=UPI003B5C402F